MKPKKKKLWLVPLWCYAGALTVYLVVCLVGLLADNAHAKAGQLAPKPLAFENLYAESMLLRENANGGSDLIATDSDPRLIYSPGEPFYAGRLTFTAEEVNRPGGEMTLYYITRPDEPFGEKKRLSARREEDGSWYFDLGGQKVQALRLDLATTGGVLWRNWALTLNAEKPWEAYFVPSVRQVFWLLFLPGFLAAVLLEGRQLLQGFILRRKAMRGRTCQ